jgi:hypothetical protein
MARRLVEVYCGIARCPLIWRVARSFGWQGDVELAMVFNL